MLNAASDERAALHLDSVCDGLPETTMSPQALSLALKSLSEQLRQKNGAACLATFRLVRARFPNGLR